MGKSTANKFLLGYAQEHGAIVVAHDDVKREQQIEGVTREHPDDLTARPVTDEEAAQGALVFRGNPQTGRVVEVEAVAAMALAMARTGIPTVIAVDELDRCMTDGGHELTSKALRAALTQGGALGLSVAATTQDPTRVPRQFKDQCTSTGFFRLGPSALNYCRERLYFDPELLTVVEKLSPHEFVIDRRGFPWDRTVYTLRT